MTTCFLRWLSDHPSLRGRRDASLSFGGQNFDIRSLEVRHDLGVWLSAHVELGKACYVYPASAGLLGLDAIAYMPEQASDSSASPRTTSVDDNVQAPKYVQPHLQIQYTETH